MPRTRSFLFLSGLVSRSGTTLLQLVLSAHRLMCISPETHCIQRCVQDMDPVSLEVDTETMLDVAAGDAKLNSWPRFRFQEFAGMFPDEATTPARTFIERLLRLHDRNCGGGSRILGNKKGFYATALAHRVKRLFPDAAFFFLYRDPRDSVPSILANLKNDGLKRTLDEVARRHEAIAGIVAAYPEDCLVLRYEDLVREPEATCRTMCAFVGIPFDPDMLSFHRANQDGRLLLGATSAMHRNTLRPFDPAAAQRWKTRLDPDLAETIATALPDIIARHGYGSV